MAGHPTGPCFLIVECVLVASKEMELMTHAWIQAAYNFPGTMSGTEDTKMD